MKKLNIIRFSKFFWAKHFYFLKYIQGLVQIIIKFKRQKFQILLFSGCETLLNAIPLYSKINNALMASYSKVKALILK